MVKTPEQVARDMRDAIREFETMLPAFLKNSVERIAKDRKDGFMKSKGPNGESWAALKPETIKQKSGKHSTTRVKRKNGISGLGKADSKPSKHPTKPLIDTGNMMNATTHVFKGRAEVRMARSRSEPISGGFESIAKIHQEGLGKNPPRPHWGIYAESRRAIDKAWEALGKTLKKRMEK